MLDVIEKNALRHKAMVVGDYLVEQLRILQDKHPIIGDIRYVRNIKY